jgi:hypothetical protein
LWGCNFEVSFEFYWCFGVLSFVLPGSSYSNLTCCFW